LRGKQPPAPNAGTAKQTAKAAILKNLMSLSIILGMRLFGTIARRPVFGRSLSGCMSPSFRKDL